MLAPYDDGRFTCIPLTFYAQIMADTYEVLTPDAMVEQYGEAAPVAINGRAMTLGQALRMEAMFCPADAIARQDPIRRLGYLARMLNDGGSLLPEHEGYLAAPEAE